jgi:hypothetical protein
MASIQTLGFRSPFAPTIAKFDFRPIFAYPFSVENDRKMDGALLVAASIVAAIRLRGQEINRARS